MSWHPLRVENNSTNTHTPSLTLTRAIRGRCESAHIWNVNLRTFGMCAGSHLPLMARMSVSVRECVCLCVHACVCAYVLMRV